MEYEVIKFENDNMELDVNVSPNEETVWLAQSQIAKLFETTQQNVSLHIKNILSDEELGDSVHKKILYTAQDGKAYNTSFYNLDMVLAVGYRIKSKRAVEFRKWASSVLKEYLLKGYVINDNRTLVTLRNYINLANHVNTMEVNLSKKLDVLEERLSAIEEKQKHLWVEDKVFNEDQMFDAIVIMTRIIEIAKQKIVLIDPYVESLTVDLFKNKRKDVELLVITSSKAKLKDNEVSAFNTQYGNLTVAIDNKIHDRYLILDDEVFYHLGSSINHLGKKLTQITLVEDSEVVGVIRKRVSELEYDIYVAGKVNKGIEDAEAGKVIDGLKALKQVKEKNNL